MKIIKLRPFPIDSQGHLIVDSVRGIFPIKGNYASVAGPRKLHELADDGWRQHFVDFTDHLYRLEANKSIKSLSRPALSSSTYLVNILSRSFKFINNLLKNAKGASDV